MMKTHIEENDVKVREPYKQYKEKGERKYADLKGFFCGEIEFSKENEPDKIKEKLILDNMYDRSRVWLLFASNDKSEWQCLQVGQSKEGVRKEVEDVVEFLLSGFICKIDGFSDSVFYENVCPVVKNESYREVLYSKIGRDNKYFKICFLDVDNYLGIEKTNGRNETDGERIVEICKNQYAEAKIAYQTLSVYWRKYNSGIDGQTNSYILDHESEFD